MASYSKTIVHKFFKNCQTLLSTESVIFKLAGSVLMFGLQYGMNTNVCDGINADSWCTLKMIWNLKGIFLRFIYNYEYTAQTLNNHKRKRHFATFQLLCPVRFGNLTVYVDHLFTSCLVRIFGVTVQRCYYPLFLTFFNKHSF